MMKIFNQFFFRRLCSLFGVFFLVAEVGCAHREKSKVSMLESSVEVIETISEGGDVNHFLKNEILRNEKERLGFASVFGAIRDPRGFHLSDQCHRESKICVRFDYHVGGEDDITRMLVGFIMEDERLKISNYSIFLSGTFEPE